MVGEVEGIEPEVQRLMLEGWKAFLQRCVEIFLAGCSEDIAILLCRERTGRGRSEDRVAAAVLDVEPLVAVSVRVGELTVTLQACSWRDLQELRAASRTDASDVL